MSIITALITFDYFHFQPHPCHPDAMKRQALYTIKSHGYVSPRVNNYSRQRFHYMQSQNDQLSHNEHGCAEKIKVVKYMLKTLKYY